MDCWAGEWHKPAVEGLSSSYPDEEYGETMDTPDTDEIVAEVCSAAPAVTTDPRPGWVTSSASSYADVSEEGKGEAGRRGGGEVESRERPISFRSGSSSSYEEVLAEKPCELEDDACWDTEEEAERDSEGKRVCLKSNSWLDVRDRDVDDSGFISSDDVYDVNCEDRELLRDGGKVDWSGLREDCWRGAGFFTTAES